MLTDPIKDYTYKDYLSYDEGERIEIIQGNIVNISLAPSRIHQKIAMDISYKIRQYIENNNGPCEVTLRHLMLY